MMKYKTEYLKMLFNDIKNGSIGQNMKEKIVKYIAYMSLEDALSIISNDKTLLNKVIWEPDIQSLYPELEQVIQTTKIPVKRAPQSSKTPLENISKSIQSYHNRDNLKNLIDSYYGRILSQKKIDNPLVPYSRSPEQYKLESLLQWMSDTDIYNLSNTKSSLELALHGMFYYQNGQSITLPFSKNDIWKSRQYLSSQISSSLVEPYALIEKNGLFHIEWPISKEHIQIQTYPYENNEVDIDSIEEDVIVIQNKKTALKWRIDMKGNEIVPCRYKEIEEFEDWLAKVQNKKWLCGFIDKSGNEIIACKYKEIEAFEEWCAKVQNENWLWGCVDKKGNEVVACTYKEIEEFEEWIVKVQNENWLRGYIDKLGNVVLECKYFTVWKFYEWLAYVENDDWWGFVDKSDKEIIPCKYKCIWKFHEWLANVQNDDWWGFIDKSGKEIIPCKYKDAWHYSEWLASVVNDKWLRGYIDKNGNEVIPCKYNYVVSFQKWLGFVKNYMWLWGIIDSNGKEIVPCKYSYIEIYSHIENFHEWLTKVQNKKWLYGFIDKSGNEVIQCKYSEIGNFHEWLVNVKNNKWCGLIDKNGNEIVACTYKNVGIFKEWLAKVESKQQLHGLVDKRGNEVVACKYKFIAVFSEWFATVINEELLWGYIDKSGIEVIPCKYKQAIVFNEWIADVMDKEWLWGVIDKNGNTIVDHNYSLLTKIESKDATIINIVWYNKNTNSIDHITIDKLWLELIHIKKDLDILNALWSPDENHKELFTSYVSDNPYRSDHKNAADPYLTRKMQWELQNNPKSFLWDIVSIPPSKTFFNTLSKQLNDDRNPNFNNKNWTSWSSSLFTHSEWKRLTIWWQQWPEHTLEKNNELFFDKKASNYIATAICSHYKDWYRMDLGHGYSKLYYTEDGKMDTTQCAIIPSEGRKSTLLANSINNFTLQNDIKVIWKNNQIIEHELEIQENGLQVIKSKEVIKQVNFSCEFSLLDIPLPEISDKQYDTFQKEYNTKYPEILSSLQWIQLPTECTLFLRSLEWLSIKEKIQHCEQYVKTVMRYDEENTNADEKSQASLEEKLLLCYQHRNTLLSTSNSDQLIDKLFVWVCEDAADIFHILLWKLGIISGKVMGLVEDKGDYYPHGRNYVILPDWTSYHLYELDATPSNYSIATPSSIEKELEFNKIKEKLQSEWKKISQSMKQILWSQTQENIKKTISNEYLITIQQLIVLYQQERSNLLHSAIDQKFKTMYQNDLFSSLDTQHKHILEEMHTDRIIMNQGQRKKVE